MTYPSRKHYSQAFPRSAHQRDGMSLRDYFAAKAMLHFLQTSEEGYDEVAEDAYLVADAMLSARDAKT
jgi:hypothetical protein